MVRLRYEARISVPYLLGGLKSLLAVCQRAREGPAPPPRTHVIHPTQGSLHIHAFFFFLIHPCLHLAAAAPVTNDKALLVIFRRMFISFTAGRKQHLSFEALHHSCDPDLRHPPPALSAVLPLSLFPFLLPGDIHVSGFDGMLLLLPP